MENFKRKSTTPASRIWMGVVISGIILLAAACGSGAPTSASSAPPAAAEAVNPAATNAPATTLDNICSLASPADVEAVLGQAPIGSKPGSEPDSVSGTTLYFCTYLGNGTALIVSSVNIDSAQAGETMIQSQLAQMNTENPGVVTTEESGLGNKAYWSVADKAASFAVMTNSHVFGVSLGGAIGDPAAVKDKLLVFAKAVLLNQ
jgi:hypothetical protein